MPAAEGSPRWLLVVGAPPAGEDVSPAGLREALRAGMAARWAALEAEPIDFGYDGWGTTLEER